MKTKIVGILSFFALILFLVAGIVSATINFTNVPTLSKTSNSSTITVSSNQNETLSFSIQDITSNSKKITFSSIPTIIINSTASQTITINYVVDPNFEFVFGEDYSTVLTATATGTGSPSPPANVTLHFADSNFCEVGNDGEV